MNGETRLIGVDGILIRARFRDVWQPKRITAGLVDDLERWLRWGSGKGHQAIDKRVWLSVV